MIKVYVDHDVETYRWDSGLANYITLMKQNDIEIVNNLESAELFCFILDSRTMFDQLPKTKQNNLLNFKGKIVILERVDSAVCWFRDFDKLPNAVVFKNRIMRPPELQNETMYYGRYHYKLVYDLCLQEIKQNNITENQKDISKNWGLKSLKPITNLSKVKAINWDFHSSPLSKRMQPYLSLHQQPKTYDVFCVNRDKDGIQGFYRKKARDIVNRMNVKKLTSPIPKEKYPKMLASSKIAICQAGHGEWLHQDGYCMYSKVIIIKPLCDYVEMVPDLYTDKRMIFCKPDYSDLEEKINYVLEHYDDYKEMLEDNYRFITGWTRERATVAFCEALKNVING